MLNGRSESAENRTRVVVLTADPTNVIFSVQTGEVRVRGIELEARGNVTR